MAEWWNGGVVEYKYLNTILRIKEKGLGKFLDYFYKRAPWTFPKFLSKVFGGVGTFFQKGPDPPEASIILLREQVTLVAYSKRVSH